MSYVLNYKSAFPIFKNNPTLVYLDSAATTQKPRSVIKAETDFYSKYNANVHRGIYGIAAKASTAYENVREKTASFLGASDKKEIIFTSGTTAGINLVAQSFLAPQLNAGDEVVISAMEHHANLIPWQQACLQKKAVLRIIPVNENGTLDLEIYEKLLNEKTKLVAVTHISNTLGTGNPIDKIIYSAHQKNIPVLIDAAQSIAIRDIVVSGQTVRKTGNRLPDTDYCFDADFLVFSAHKLFGPTGVGILYAKAKHLEQMQPIQFGGDMIRDVSFERTIFAPPPHRFEAGTPNVAGIIGLGAAIDFVNKIGKKNIFAHSQKLLYNAEEKLGNINGVSIISSRKSENIRELKSDNQQTPKIREMISEIRDSKSAIISFLIEEVHPHDAATILAERNICIRAGQHCTQPLMDFFNLPATLRASFSIYNTEDDVDKLISGIKEVKKIMRVK